jgi:hypothetical protein
MGFNAPDQATLEQYRNAAESESDQSAGCADTILTPR